ncbi:LacI family DNA-binding transcriptional regulator [Frigoribacterium sp. PhB24]|uniref:LacI family DNA-binding transcriptional regulator n=1 Tax=Frigoribacterium sp. PhB24 TaxID=2485204 RepID=UPI000FB9929D|nr:substrate-binding domain-containing protein [Frigoribacterium sp. PhB24]ROS54505.1 LacI family transcriptional regulator [Frigoribacterium sp. PhB24]
MRDATLTESDRSSRLPRPIGLTLVRPSEIYGAEPYFHELTAGLDRVVRPRGHAVLLRVLPDRDAELELCRRWSAEGVVDAVVLVDLSVDDPRVSLVSELGLPAISVSSPTISNGLPAVWTNDDVAVQEAVEALASLGHVRLAHVSGPLRLAHSVARRDTFVSVCDDRGLTAATVTGDYSFESGERALAALLDGPVDSDDQAVEGAPAGPTAVVFDNDLMALGGLAEARRLGLNVPGDLSIVAWDDSAQCQLSEPALSALSHDVQRIGEMVGETVLAVLDGERPPTLEAPPIVFVPRATTGPPVH